MFYVYLFILCSVMVSASEQLKTYFTDHPCKLFVTEKSAEKPNLCRWNDFDSVTMGALSCVNKELQQKISSARNLILNHELFKKRFKAVAYIKKHTMVFNKNGEWCVLGKRASSTHTIIFFGDMSTLHVHIADQRPVYSWGGRDMVSPMDVRLIDHANQQILQTSIFCIMHNGVRRREDTKQANLFLVAPQYTFCWYISAKYPSDDDNAWSILNFKKTVQRIIEIPAWLHDNCALNKDGTLAYQGNCNISHPLSNVQHDYLLEPYSVSFDVDLSSGLFHRKWWHNSSAFSDDNISDDELMRIAEAEELNSLIIARRKKERRHHQEWQLEEGRLLVENNKPKNKMCSWIKLNNSDCYSRSSYQYKIFDSFAAVFNDLQKTVGTDPAAAWKAYHEAYPDKPMPRINVKCSTRPEKIYAMLASFGGYNVHFPPIQYSFWSWEDSRPLRLLALSSVLLAPLSFAPMYFRSFGIAFLSRAYEEKICSNRMQYGLYTGSILAGYYGVAKFYGLGSLGCLAFTGVPLLFTAFDVAFKSAKIFSGDHITVPLMDLWRSWPMRAYRAQKMSFSDGSNALFSINNAT